MGAIGLEVRSGTDAGSGSQGASLTDVLGGASASALGGTLQVGAADASAAAARRYPAIGISTITSGRQGNALNSLRQIGSDGAAYPVQTLSSEQVAASPSSSDGYFITGDGGAVSSIYGYDGSRAEPLATGSTVDAVSYMVVIGGVDVDASETSDMAKLAADAYGGQVYGLNNQTVDPVSDFIEVADNRRENHDWLKLANSPNGQDGTLRLSRSEFATNVNATSLPLASTIIAAERNGETMRIVAHSGGTAATETALASVVYTFGMEEARDAYAAANGGGEPVSSAQLFAFLDANPDIEQAAIQSARMRVADTVELETFNGVAPGYSVAGTHNEAESDPVVGLAEGLLGWQVTGQGAGFRDGLPSGSVVNTLPVHTHGFGANLDARDMPMQTTITP